MFAPGDNSDSATDLRLLGSWYDPNYPSTIYIFNPDSSYSLSYQNNGPVNIKGDYYADSTTMILTLTPLNENNIYYNYSFPNDNMLNITYYGAPGGAGSTNYIKQ